MTFVLREDGSCAAGRCIAARGLVLPETIAEFSRFVSAHGVPSGAELQLDSTGGDVVSALKLGLLVRRRGLNTHVTAPDARTGVQGVCASACAYVFLGGVGRHIDEEARLGMHQFLPISRPGDTSEAQRVVGLISIYLDAIGAHPRLERLALMTPPDKMRWLSVAELGSLGVVTTPQGARLADGSP